MSRSVSSDPDPLNGQFGPYRALDTSDRRVAAGVYLVSAVLAGVLVVVSGVDLMWLTVVLPLLLLAGYQTVAGKSMKVGDMEAIAIGSEKAPFEVGHGSATLGFAGLMARPVWQVLVFEAGAAPHHQALITVDAHTGSVGDTYAEAVDLPEV